MLEIHPSLCHDPQFQFLSFAIEIGATIIYLLLEAIKPNKKSKFNSTND